MPRYLINSEDATSIVVDSNDILQLKTNASIEIKNSDNIADAASFVMRGYLSSMNFNRTITLSVKGLRAGVTVTVDVIKGL